MLLCVCTKRACSLRAPQLLPAETADNTDDKTKRKLTEFDQSGQDGQPGNINAPFIQNKSLKLDQHHQAGSRSEDHRKTSAAI